MENKTKATQVLSTVSPHYCMEEPPLFFAQWELECEIRGLSSQKAKFHLAVSRLPHEAMLEEREIIFSPTKEKPYSKQR